MPPYFYILATKKTPKVAACPAVNLNLSCSFAIAAEQKARTTYDNILKLCDDPDVADPIRFLREREIVHYQRFGEALDKIQQNLTEKNKFYISK